MRCVCRKCWRKMENTEMTDTVTDDRRVNRLLKWLDAQREAHEGMVCGADAASQWAIDEAELIRDHMGTIETMRREIEELDFLRHEGGPQSVAAMEAALKTALPVMRRTACEYLSSVMVNGNPSTIAPTEWAEIAPDLDAIAAAEACVGRPGNAVPEWMDGLTRTLDDILDDKRWRKHVEATDAAASLPV